ncbi:MAG: carbamoyl-phosphate synthase large subunit, partial [Acidimicrobiia bacterium]|nr:carbamoyl-phosphate synthase large subunit [Acidimicrobiia bacterium]
AIQMAEDRQEFADAMERIGLKCAAGRMVHSRDEALETVKETGYPAIIRPSYTLGGTGGGVAYNRDEFLRLVDYALDQSPSTSALIEQSVLGWKEFELEVMRDGRDNVVIVCSIENFDPMGVHTGDSVTVAPAMTLSDREYQELRNAAIAIIREIGVEAGGCNIQFAVSPTTGEVLVIEMNPRVSRSSALASKATGFPIARIGAKLAVGYTLDELPNDITKTTPASFEPVLDYVVVKFPRFAFEKFPAADRTLTTQMKSVGESMAIGRTFKEAVQKGIRALETGRLGWSEGPQPEDDGLITDDRDELAMALGTPVPERLFQLRRAMRHGFSDEELYRITSIDPWFLGQLRELYDADTAFRAAPTWTPDSIRGLKRLGFSDAQLGEASGRSEEDVRQFRWEHGIHPCYKMVDTCAGEFPSATPYLYSTYDDENESEPLGADGIVILGSGPNRIGQGVEFDYCCVR